MGGDHPHGVVTAVMHDTVDLDDAVRFWTAVLGLDVIHRDETFCYLTPLCTGGPHLAFQRVPEVKAAKNRMHLDIRVPDRVAFEQQILELGGAKVEEHHPPGWPSWSVMADPEGHEFCIYEPEDSAA